jgi:hypothetical protein
MSEPVKLGRPRRDATSVKSALMHICSTRREKERYEALAAALGISLSALVRSLLDARLALHRQESSHAYELDELLPFESDTTLELIEKWRGNPEHIHSGRPLYDDSKERPK